MKLIILDRDGVINEDSDNYIKSPEEWWPIPGSLEAIARLKRAGYNIAVATNQSGIGRGYYDLATLAAMHAKMQRLLAEHDAKATIDFIAYCPHHPDDHCACRKPKTGLFKQIAEYFSCDLKGVPMVGDSLSDIQAAEKMQCQTALVKTGKGTRSIKSAKLPPDLPIFTDLSHYVDCLLASK